ncbi:putative toxin-antitoxin system toxin component, PIN family [Gracilimonas mengyeensis]|uniref:Putative toxin-antitoxin system toxin component, PIN family n=1 Tax=Gracilimonas mengyeensis TaxID=1302730 RepID=A0A521BI76_9BACT|nr:putative toxin-antitoxin system toxin component, PIN family [Gracilimonas mengyeensis]SMO46834.1 putative toxin-antitoxin system toxin component, PIN family [Gracilimonas mengyeensis]
MSVHQIVLDTNIIYSALRSKRGASYRLMSLLNSSKFEFNLSVPLIIEYEDVLVRKIETLNFDASQISQFLDYLCLIGNWHEVYFLWRPVLKDPKDDMVLELAVRANCKYIVTYNKTDFQGVDKFGVKLATAKEFLQIIEELP